jgi:hypothetical protein
MLSQYPVIAKVCHFPELANPLLAGRLSSLVSNTDLD